LNIIIKAIVGERECLVRGSADGSHLRVGCWVDDGGFWVEGKFEYGNLKVMREDARKMKNN
jgi:hypothetical protein